MTSNALCACEFCFQMSQQEGTVNPLDISHMDMQLFDLSWQRSIMEACIVKGEVGGH